MATDMNTCAVVGRMTAKPRLEYTKSGLAKMSFSLACNRAKKLEDGSWGSEADFFEILYMGKGAEAIAPYADRGRQAAVVGRLRQSRWEKDGQRHSRVYISADSVQLLGGRGDGAAASPPTASAGAGDEPPNGWAGEDFPEDVPF